MHGTPHNLPAHDIGALEIGARLQDLDGDAALEATALSTIGPSVQNPCTKPTMRSAGCHIDDAALEAASSTIGLPTTPMAGCPFTVNLACRRIDDDAALEASGLFASPHTQGAGCPVAPTWGCRTPGRIDNDA